MHTQTPDLLFLSLSLLTHSSPDAQRLAEAPRPPHGSPAPDAQSSQQPHASSSVPEEQPSAGSGAHLLGSQVPQLRGSRSADTTANSVNSRTQIMVRCEGSQFGSESAAAFCFLLWDGGTRPRPWQDQKLRLSKYILLSWRSSVVIGIIYDTLEYQRVH